METNQQVMKKILEDLIRVRGEAGKNYEFLREILDDEDKATYMLSFITVVATVHKPFRNQLMVLIAS